MSEPKAKQKRRFTKRQLEIFVSAYRLGVEAGFREFPIIFGTCQDPSHPREPFDGILQQRKKEEV